MKQEINLHNFDIIKAISYAHYRNKLIWGICIVAALLTEGVGYIGLWATGWPLSGIVSVTFNVLIFILILNTVGLICTVLGLLLNPKWRKGRVGWHEIELSDKAILESTKYNKTEIFWPAVNDVVIKQNALYFVHQGSEVFIIPKRCFTSKESWDEFTKILLTTWTQQKNA